MCRRVNSSLYKSISENFQEHLRFLELNELDQRNASIKTNGRGLKKKEDYNSPFELIKSVNTSYYLNGGILVTNGLLWIPNGDKPDFISGEKISIQKLYELFRGTCPHGRVTIQFLSALNLFFGRKEEI